MFRISLFITFVLFNFSISAQSVSDDLESIVVSASRVPVSVALSGSSVTVIDRESIEKRQLSSLSEILREVPGLSVNRGGVLGSSTQIRVRGAEANQLLVFIDGIEVNDLAQSSEYNFAHLSASEIENAEIIRGPQSALWGSDALAGVINIKTRRGSGPMKISAFAEGGSFGSAHGGGNISGGTEKYHYSLSGSYLRSGGDNISRNGKENDGYKNGTLSFSAGYMPLEELSIELTSRFTEARNEFDATDFFTTGLPADSNDETSTSQNYTRLQSKLSLFEGRWQHRVGIALSNTDNDNFANNTESDSNQGKKYRFDYQTSVHTETSYLTDASHSLTFALEHEIEEFTQRGAISFGSDPNQDRKLDTTSYVGEYRVTFAEQLSVSAGVRHDNNSDFRNATTFRTTAAYLLDEHGLRLHGSYGTGVKNPTFTERFGFFASSLFSPFVGNPNLSPEKSRGWELGVSKDFLGSRLNIDLTYFNEKLEDEINGFFFDISTLTSTAVNETGISKRQGIELSGLALLSERLSMSANYTYLDATQADATGAQLREIRRPKHIANLAFDYIFMDERANLNLSANYNGKQSDFFFPPPFFSQETVSLNSFTLVNLTGSFQLSRQMSLYGRIENLLDDNYEEILGFQSTGIAFYAGIKLNMSK